MKTFHRWFLIVFIFAFIFSGALSNSSADTVSIRSEGGSSVEAGDVTTARENAIQNALRKAVRAYVTELVSLSKAENDRLMPAIERGTEYYVVKHDVVEEGVIKDVVRIILDIELMPDKLVGQILDSGFLASFRHKPRILIALPNEYKALTTALSKGFIDLGFYMIDGSKRWAELNTAINTGNSVAVVEVGKELGADVIITGECLSDEVQSKRLGNFKSYRVEAALQAVGCSDGRILAAGNYEGVCPSISRIKGQAEAANKMAKSVVEEFPRKIMQIWATQVSTGEIELKPLPGGSAPPQIMISSPDDGKLTEEKVIRLIATVSDDKGESSVKLFINGASLALEKDLHLSSEANGLLINRLVPLKNGENTISIVALDQDENKVEEELKVISNPRIAEEVPVRIEIQTPLPDEKLSERDVSVVGEVISSVPMQEQIEVTVNGVVTPASRGMRRVKKKGTSSFPFEREVRLSPGGNRIEVIAKTEAGQECKKSVSVTYNAPMSSSQSGAMGKYAVIIGVSKYKDPDIRSLQFASVDAESIYKLVTDPDGGGFPEENVRLLTNEQATRDAIMKTLGEWLPEQVKAGDMVLLFYAGHGGVEADLTGEESDGNSKYLIPYDSELGSLFSTAILNSMMTTMLRRINSKQMVFLIDCCYSGGSTNVEAIRSTSPPDTKVETDVYGDFAGSGRVVISASQPDQFSLELPEWNHGLFTYNLLKGISGEADYNKDGFIALTAEVWPYVSSEVKRMAVTYGYEQDPMLRCEITGKLLLSKVVDVSQ